jgi:hypothetical protein
MKCLGVILLCVLVCFAGVGDARRHLLEEQIRTAVENFGAGNEETTDATTKSLSRMLLAFQALGGLKDKSALLGHSPWKDALLDNEKLNLMGLKDYKTEDFRDGSIASGATDTASDVLKSKQDLMSKIVGVATGDLTLEQAAAGQIATLAKYLDAYIQQETALLEAHGKGSPDDQFSYLLEAPANNRVANKILNPFGLLDVTSFVNLTNALQEKFCSPMVLLPRRSTGRRTVINGPAFELTMSTGGCEMKFGFGDDNIPFTTVPQKSISCTGKEISYTKTPVSIHRQDILPEAFSSQECKVERKFGTAYEKVLYGGGPLVRFNSVDELIDALVTKKYNIFAGLNDLIDRNATAESINLQKRDAMSDVFDFWSSLGPGRLLKDKKLFGKKIPLKKFPLSTKLDFGVTSPLGFGLKDKKLSPLSKLNLKDQFFTLSKDNLFTRLKKKGLFTSKS